MKQGRTVRAMLAGGTMALDMRHGRDLLAIDLDAVAAQAAVGHRAGAFAAAGLVAGELRVEPGERFAVLRGVAVMPVRGILTPASEMLERFLGWATYAGIEAAADQLAADADVTAVILDMNSPGGLVLAAEAAGDAIARLAAVKPVHVLVNPLAGSAAYWLAVQATTITMTPGSLVGSIGAMKEAHAPVQPDEDGEQWAVITSSHARGKRPDPTTEAGRIELQRDVDDAEARFLAAVAAGRGIDPAQLPAILSVTDDPADGGVTYEFDAAAARGLVDGRETRAAFYDRIFAAHGLQPRKPQGAARATFAAQAAAAAAIATT